MGLYKIGLLFAILPSLFITLYTPLVGILFIGFGEGCWRDAPEVDGMTGDLTGDLEDADLTDDLNGDLEDDEDFINAVIGNVLTGFPLTNLPVSGFIFFP